ncbi:polysaccharide deacetylase family protein [Hymenobacter sp. M29]|uniref:Polysaccharide deacetylase family protein n=1 Tax=Hymenobacter mellowenesis TaxID=3063995 RepID=A0ABT9AG46_9BACT|nr:polysaccharide deacetylase family protein [Hymenobacter sp. M29]MDO7848799.1 polysaccharide deacetylase family protein [Hymenobacter sp. M29]
MRAFSLRFPLTTLLCAGALVASAQKAAPVPVSPYENAVFLRRLYADTAYTGLKKRVSRVFATARPGQWGEFVQGVDEDLTTQQRIIALTFDACGGPHGSGYDADLVDYLRREKIPATLCVSGRWIDRNLATFRELARDPLFEIANHGFNHRPCSIDGESEYGIRGTPDAADAFDEIEANRRKIQAITGRAPRFFRSATAFTDEACARLARQLDVTMFSFDVLSGDAVAGTPKEAITENVVKGARPGAIVIMHFNRPAWNSAEALRDIIPVLRAQGYQFARLQDFPLRGR